MRVQRNDTARGALPVAMGAPRAVGRLVAGVLEDVQAEVAIAGRDVFDAVALEHLDAPEVVVGAGGTATELERVRELFRPGGEACSRLSQARHVKPG